MAVGISIYSNANNKTQTVNIDFVADFLAASLSGVSNELQYFFKFTTSARDLDNSQLPVKIVEGLGDLPLMEGSNVSSTRYRSATNSTNAYEDIRTMVIDYIYDYTQGHTENQWLSGCYEQKAMKFTS